MGGRHGWDLALLWLRHRPAATAPIRPLAWEPPYTAGAALKKKTKDKKRKGRKLYLRSGRKKKPQKNS